MAVADLREGEGYPLSYWQKFITYIYIYIFLNTKENPICTIKLMSNFK